MSISQRYIPLLNDTFKPSLCCNDRSQNKTIRIINFSSFSDHTSPLFKDLNVIKLFDEVTFHIAVFMYKFRNQLLPSNFDVFFTSVKETHNYNTRLSR